MDEKINHLLSTMQELKLATHYDLLKVLNKSLIYNNDEEINETIEFAKNKDLIVFEKQDKDPRSIPKYSLTKDGISFFEKNQLEKQKIEEINSLRFQKLQSDVILIQNQLFDYEKTKSRSKISILIAWLSLLLAVITLLIQYFKK